MVEMRKDGHSNPKQKEEVRSRDAKGNPKGGKTQTSWEKRLERKQMTKEIQKPGDRRGEKVHSEGVSTPETAD